MRTDMKVGILAGLIIALGIVVYLFSGIGKDKSSSNNAAPAADSSAGKPSSGAPFVASATPAPAADSGAVHISDVIVAGPTPSPADSTGGPLPPPTPAAVGIPVPTPPPAPTSTPEATAIVPHLPEPSLGAPTPPPSIDSGSVSAIHPTPPGSPVVTPVPVTPVAPVGATRTYVVEKGDTFWSIAEKEYGDGGKQALIAKANPNISSSRLRVGQKLTIPPSTTTPTAVTPSPAPTPVPTPAPAGTVPEPVAPAPAPTATAPASPTSLASEEYVVQEGDTGFWGIAKKKYGDGSKWYLIEKANPKVDPRQLHVGTRLKIPALPATERPAKDKATTSRPAPTPASRPAATPRTTAAPTPPSDNRPRFDVN